VVFDPKKLEAAISDLLNTVSLQTEAVLSGQFYGPNANPQALVAQLALIENNVKTAKAWAKQLK
jgi:hypothetical protein